MPNEKSGKCQDNRDNVNARVLYHCNERRPVLVKNEEFHRQHVTKQGAQMRGKHVQYS